MYLLFLLTLALVMAWFFVAIPVSSYVASRSSEEYRETHRRLKLRAVRKYHWAFREHSPLRRLSDREIERRFDLDALYNQLR